MIPSKDLSEEWFYRYTERLGIMCGTDAPTQEQINIAISEANAAIKILKEQDVQ